MVLNRLSLSSGAVLAPLHQTVSVRAVGVPHLCLLLSEISLEGRVHCSPDVSEGLCHWGCGWQSRPSGGWHSPGPLHPWATVVQVYHLVVPPVLFFLQGSQIWIFPALVLPSGDRVMPRKRWTLKHPSPASHRWDIPQRSLPSIWN